MIREISARRKRESDPMAGRMCMSAMRAVSLTRGSTAMTILSAACEKVRIVRFAFGIWWET